MIVHVIPVNDLKEHSNDSDVPCECEPTAKIIENGIMYVHNSYDGREYVEQANEILKQENNGK